MMQQEVVFEDLGRRAYKEIWDYQESLLKANTDIKAAARQAEIPVSPAELATRHRLLFVEHEPVYTLGKNGKDMHVLINEAEREQKGISYFHINRGGDITFHGPGQIVGYPIIDLEKFRADLGWYLRSLEEVIIRTMADYGLEGKRSAGETGVWLNPDTRGKERKICAMGIKCSRWITMHGFALNVNTDLDYFNFIIPCGIQGKQVTSLRKELGREIPMQEVSEKLRKYFEEVFGCRLV
jgi:lipoyl(octanoyl) transferase